MPDEPPILDGARQNAIRLFDYLARLVKLRTRVIRDVKGYDDCFWLSDLPRERECSTAAWPEASRTGWNTWLRIRKPQEPAFPDPPADCAAWADEDTLHDTAGEPALRGEIDDPSWRDGDGAGDDIETPRRLRLSDFPQIVEQWQQYVNNAWRGWRDEYLRWQRVQKAYGRLFSIYQVLRRRGEEFELAMGVGTLVWQTPTRYRVRHPIITAPAVISLESESGSIVVTAPSEGTQLAAEQDFLLSEHRPPDADQAALRDQAKDLETLWDRDQLFPILKSWARNLPHEGSDFSEEILVPERIGIVPVVVYAPVLILRRKGGHAMLQALDTIGAQLRGGGIVPRVMRRICRGDGEGVHDDAQGNAPPAPLVPAEALFPLPANDEQELILRRLEGRPGIRVQGPPGTGKSHTIVNLLSHFIAMGKRVLVTSQAPRALKVLHRMVPDNIKGLCISVLGDDRESLNNLKASARAILDRDADALPNETRVESCRTRRKDLRSEICLLKNRQREVRKSETDTRYFAGTDYQGSLENIGRRLENTRPELGWIPCDVPEGSQPPLTVEEMVDLAALQSAFGPGKPAILAANLPPEDLLPAARDFATMAVACREARRE
jgi:hypothetical protein